MKFFIIVINIIIFWFLFALGSYVAKTYNYKIVPSSLGLLYAGIYAVTIQGIIMFLEYFDLVFW